LLTNRKQITTSEIKKSILAGDITPPKVIVQDLPDNINSFILRCIDRDTKKRFKNIKAMKAGF